MISNCLYVYEYDVAAIVMDVLLLAIFYVRNRHVSNSNRIFGIIIICNLLASVTDLISCFTISDPYGCPLWFNYVVSLGYLFFYNMLSVLFLMYIAVRGRIEKQIRVVFAGCMVMTVFYALTIFSSPWTHLVAYFDENLVYGHGPIFNLLFGLPFAIFIWELYIFITARANFTKYQYLSSSLLVIGMAISIGITIVFPNILIGQFIMSLITVFVYVTYENPAYYCFRDTQCGNRYAFGEVLDRMAYKKRMVKAVVFKIEDFKVIRGRYSSSDFDKLIVRVSDLFYQSFKEKAFFLEENVIIVLSDNETKTVEKVSTVFGPPVIVGHIRRKIRFEHFVFSTRAENPADIELVLSKMTTSVFPDNFKKVLGDIKNEMLYDQQLGTAIKRGIAMSSFEIYYQPIYNLKTKCFESAEALIRLDDADLGFINPEEMIVYAERNGLINDVGNIVFKMVCRCISNNNLRRLGIKYIEINLSPLQCLNPSLVADFHSIMEAYNVSPNQINLEFTETAESSGEALFYDNIHGLEKLGISFSIDDYGSGFASASYLTKFPIEIVKIDREILWNAMKDESAMLVFKSTVKLLQALGKKIVVEGGETKEMIDLLIDEDCDYCQGFYYSKPLPEEEFIEFVKSKL